MADSFASRIIAAHQAGLQERQRKEKQAQDAEDRQFTLKQREAQLRLDKINEQLAKRRLEQENAQSMQGMPAPVLGVASPQATPMPFPGQVGQGPSMEAPPQNIPLPLPAQSISGVEELGVPGYQQPVTSMQQLLQQKNEAARQASELKRQESAAEPFTLAEGASRVIPQPSGPSQVFTNPKTTQPTERNQQFRDVERQGRVVRQYFEGSDPSKVTFEVDTGSVDDKTKDPLSAYQRNQTFLNISNKYQADAIVNQSIKGQTAKAIADQVIANPEKATNQLSSLYLYVKNLDADSAVREGEVALAQLTQSYFQRFTTALTRVAAGQILAPAAAKELALATKDLVSAWEKTAVTRTQQYKAQAVVAGVGSQFDQYLTGFQRIQGSGTAEAPAGQWKVISVK